MRISSSRSLSERTPLWAVRAESDEKHVRTRKEHTKSHQSDRTQTRKGPADTSQDARRDRRL